MAFRHHSSQPNSRFICNNIKGQVMPASCRQNSKLHCAWIFNTEQTISEAGHICTAATAAWLNGRIYLFESHRIGTRMRGAHQSELKVRLAKISKKIRQATNSFSD